MNRDTVAIYDRAARSYAQARQPVRAGEARRFGRAINGWRADLGCGAGRYTESLGAPVIAIDASIEMLRVARPAVAVQADLTALPLRRNALGGAWSNMAYHHIPREVVPMALADLHRTVAVDGPIDLTVLEGTYTGNDLPHDDFPGRFFACWTLDDLVDVVVGAGFTVEVADMIGPNAHVAGRRARTLADTVGPGMRLLVCGLNPSVYAADAGVGYARPGNRFWPAALAAGLVSRQRDATHALVHHRVGLTDLVKRATTAASELTRAEYIDGAARVERLVGWLQPGAICFVGLAGYRAAIDRAATVGWQQQPFGGRPTYVMPSTSGLNARTLFDELVEHLRWAISPPS